MGMYDELFFDCPKCGRNIEIQLKICEYPFLRQWHIGSKIKKEEIYSEYHRHIISPKYDRCPKCKSVFVFDCTSGFVNIEIWDEKEKMEDPTNDYEKDFSFWIEVYSKPREAGNILQISLMLGDTDIFKYFF